MKQIYIECWGPAKAQWQEEYPNAIFVPNEGHLWVLGKGIKEALHNVHAPQQGENWRIVSNGYYHSIVEISGIAVTEQAAKCLFGTHYAGWVNFLENTFKEPYDQVENKMRDNKQFYNQVLLVACKERIPNNWVVNDVVEVFDYILSL